MGQAAEEALGGCVHAWCVQTPVLRTARDTEIISPAEGERVCDDLCSHRAALREAEMDGGWEGGGEEGVLLRSGFETRVVI